MDMTPISFDAAARGDLPGDPSPVDAAARKWSALHEAAALVAALAGTEDHWSAAELAHYPAMLAAAPPWRRDLAGQGIEDLTAIMKPGLAALIAVRSGGGEAAVPARALWEEYAISRDALLALVAVEN